MDRTLEPIQATVLKEAPPEQIAWVKPWSERILFCTSLLYGCVDGQDTGFTSVLAGMLPQVADPSRRKRERLGDQEEKALDTHCSGLKGLLMKTGLGQSRASQ